MVYTTCPDKIVMCRFLYSTPIDRTRDESYYLFHPYRQDPWCVVLFIPPLSTGPVMCRFLYSTPIDKTRDVSYYLFHPYRQDPWCVGLFIPPLSTGLVMCRWLGSPLINMPSRGPLHGQHVAIRMKARKGRLRCYSNIYFITPELWKFVAGVKWLSGTAIGT